MSGMGKRGRQARVHVIENEEEHRVRKLKLRPCIVLSTSAHASEIASTRTK